MLVEIRDLYIEKPIVYDRVSYGYEDKWIGLMPGIDPDIGFVLKIIGIYPRATPRVKGYIVVSDLETGELKMIADAASATGWRTATASALATKLLLECDLRERCRIEKLGLIGAGFQGDYHLRVFKILFDIDSIYVYDTDVNRSRYLCEKYNARMSPLESLLIESDVVIAATSSLQPVVRGELVKRGGIVVSIGAPRPVREIDDTTRRRAGCALVDTVSGVSRESDDVRDIRLVELGDYIRGVRCEFREIKLYKSVGTSLLDIAIARHLLKRVASIKA
ncbi:MAG: hypothetical protein ABWJ42_04680 [Sulfolobales archaeon]